MLTVLSLPFEPGSLYLQLVHEDSLGKHIIRNSFKWFTIEVF